MSLSNSTGRWVERKAGAGGGDADKQPYEELTSYIPLEAVTIFLALVSLINGLEELGRTISLPLVGVVGEFDAYVLCGIVVVPLVVFLVKLAKEKKDGVKTGVPTWPIAAGLLAYAVWGLTVPGVFEDPVLHVVAAPAAIIVSKILSLVEGVIG